MWRWSRAQPSGYTSRSRRSAPERVRTRARVQVREQQQVAPFAVTGFLTVAAIAVVVLLSYVQLYQVNTEAVELRSQLE